MTTADTARWAALKRDKRLPALDRARFNLLWASGHLLGPQRLEEWRREQQKQLDARLLAHLQARGPGRETAVERVEGISPSDFRKYFQRRALPVILAGAAKNWKCTGLWSPEYFAERHAQEASSVTDYGGDEAFANLKYVVDGMRQRTLKASHFSKIVHNSPELISHIDVEYLRTFIQPLSHTTSYQFFMGPAGAATATHAGGTNNFHIQIYGEKTWRIVDTRFNPVLRPRLTRSPLISSTYDPTWPDDNFPTDRYIPVYRAKIRAGDVLYMQTYYWHHVSYDTDSIAAGVRWWSPFDVWRTSAMMFFITVTATNPPVFEYYLDITRGRLNKFFGSANPERLVR